MLKFEIDRVNKNSLTVQTIQGKHWAITGLICIFLKSFRFNKYWVFSLQNKDKLGNEKQPSTTAYRQKDISDEAKNEGKPTVLTCIGKSLVLINVL